MRVSRIRLQAPIFLLLLAGSLPGCIDDPFEPRHLVPQVSVAEYEVHGRTEGVLQVVFDASGGWLHVAAKYKGDDSWWNMTFDPSGLLLEARRGAERESAFGAVRMLPDAADASPSAFEVAPYGLPWVDAFSLNGTTTIRGDGQTQKSVQVPCERWCAVGLARQTASVEFNEITTTFTEGEFWPTTYTIHNRGQEILNATRTGLQESPAQVPLTFAPAPGPSIPGPRAALCGYAPCHTPIGNLSMHEGLDALQNTSAWQQWNAPDAAPHILLVSGNAVTRFTLFPPADLGQIDRHTIVWSFDFYSDSQRNGMTFRLEKELNPLTGTWGPVLLMASDEISIGDRFPPIPDWNEPTTPVATLLDTASAHAQPGQDPRTFWVINEPTANHPNPEYRRQAVFTFPQQVVVQSLESGRLIHTYPVEPTDP